MREAIVYLTIACLSMSNSCFGMQDNTRTSSGLLQNEKALSAGQEYTSFEKGVVRSKKDLRVAKRQSAKQNFVKYIFCTTALASISAFAYFFILGASNFVNSKVKYFVNFVNNKFKSEGVNIIDQVKISASEKMVETLENNKVIENTVPEYAMANPMLVFGTLTAIPYVLMLFNAVFGH